MASSIIGQLRVILGLDTAAFEKGISDAQRQMARAGRSFEQIGRRIESVGQSLSVALALPLAAIGGASLKMASDFEAAMNRVEAATGASGAQLKALRDQARAFGADPTFTATAADAAQVMENLAKNGLSATQILGGATEATLKLAAANAADFGPAADLVTDIMQQFGKQASDLNGIVDKLTGGMLVSKFGFDDYRLAIGQAGGVAGGLGVSFEDANVALAATAALFTSGSDAGTSFKNFLTSLTPTSKEAAEAIQKYGLSFFDATGKMKPIADIAQQLRDKLGGLADQAKQPILKTIFGQDSMRVAIALMAQGRDGLERLRAEIDKASAQTQMEARMKGWAAALTQVKKAFEAAAIALGDSGFLDGLTAVARSVANAIRAFASLPQPVLAAIGALAGIAAVAGPLVFMTGKLAGMWGALVQLLPRLAAALGTTAIAEGAVAAGATTAATGMGLLEGAMAFLTGPWGLVIGGIAIALGALALSADKTSQSVRDAQATLDEMNAKHRDAETAVSGMTNALKVATDHMADEIDKARELATALYGVEAGARAAAVALARQQLAAAKSQYEQVANSDDRTLFARTMGAPRNNLYHRARVAPFQAQLDQRKRQLDEAQAAYDLAVADSKDRKFQTRFGYGPGAAGTERMRGLGGLKINPSVGDAGGGSHRTKKGPDEERLASRREELRLDAQIEAARAQGDEATAQRLQDQMDLTRQIEAYRQAGLTTDQARAAAQADMKAIQDARAVAAAKEIADEQRSLQIDAARLANDHATEEALQRQADIEQRIEFYKKNLVTITDEKLRLEEATKRALEDQARIDAAIAKQRADWQEEDQLSRELHLAQLRGDSDVRQRQLQAELDMRQRIRDLEAQGVDPESARAQAQTEAMENEQARQQGIFRDTIKGGFRAALDGDFKGWFKNWWKDQAAKGMEEALNSLGDLLQKLFGQVQIGSGAGGGGFLGLGNLLGGGGLGGLLGGGGPMSGFSLGSDSAVLQPTPFSPDFSGIDSLFSGMPGFANGGSGKIIGIPGMDRNLLSLNGRPIAKVSHGETLKVSPKNDNGPAGGYFHFDLRGAVMTQDLLDQMNAMAAQARDEGSAQAIGIIGRGRTRQLPRRGRQ